jgi:hypothetical protein
VVWFHAVDVKSLAIRFEMDSVCTFAFGAIGLDIQGSRQSVRPPTGRPNLRITGNKIVNEACNDSFAA